MDQPSADSAATLSGKTVIVGGPRGIGRAIVRRRLAADGAAVVFDVVRTRRRRRRPRAK